MVQRISILNGRRIGGDKHDKEIPEIHMENPKGIQYNIYYREILQLSRIPMEIILLCHMTFSSRASVKINWEDVEAYLKQYIGEFYQIAKRRRFGIYG